MAYPVLTTASIQPADLKLTMPLARKALQKILVATGFCDATTARDFARYFADDMRTQLWYVRDQANGDIENYSDEARELKADLPELQADLHAAIDNDSRFRAEDAYHRAVARLAEVERRLAAARTAVADFKADYRQAVIDHANQLLHGISHKR